MAIPVIVSSLDRVLEGGVAAQLRGRHEVRLVDPLDIDAAKVAIVAVDEVSDASVRLVRAIQRNGCPRVVVVAARLDEAAVLLGVEAGACAMLRTCEVTPERLVESVVGAAAGAGCLSPDLLGQLLQRVGQLQRDTVPVGGPGSTGLSQRELDVLRLVAEGLDTTEVAHQLAYSERTIKGIIHGITTRLQLRNRTHAVAFAVREGLI